MNPMFNLTFSIVPTIRNGQYIIKDNYRYTSYIEEGRPTIPEPEITDCSDALELIANIKAKL